MGEANAALEGARARLGGMRAALVGTVVVVALAGCIDRKPPLEPVSPAVILPPPSAPTRLETPARPVAVEPASVPLTIAFREELLTEARRGSGADVELLLSGHERERARDLPGARKEYFQLIQQHPTSPLVPHAYLAFSDLFLEESNGDPSKLALAQQAYQEVVKYPPPKNRAYAYAWHQLGVAFARNHEPEKALNAQKKCVAAILDDATTPLARRIAEAARRELVVAYAGSGQPERAIDFFRTVDPAAKDEMVTALGEE